MDADLGRRRQETSPDRVELLRRAAEAAHLSGDSDRAVALGRSALGLVDATSAPLAAATLHERIGRYLWVCGLQRDAIEELGRAVAVMPWWCANLRSSRAASCPQASP